MADLSALIERLAKLDGPSREVDAQIVAFLNNAAVRPYPPTDDFGPKNKWQFWSLGGQHFLGSESKFPVPELTESIDAIVALIGKVLTEADAVWSLMTDYGGLCRARIHCFPNAWVPAGGSPGKEYQADGATPAIALCIALLQAIKEREGKP